MLVVDGAGNEKNRDSYVGRLISDSTPSFPKQVFLLKTHTAASRIEQVDG